MQAIISTCTVYKDEPMASPVRGDSMADIWSRDGKKIEVETHAIITLLNYVVVYNDMRLLFQMACARVVTRP